MRTTTGIGSPDRIATVICLAVVIASCAGCARNTNAPVALQPPDVRPDRAVEDAEPLELDASQIKPMFTELVPVDLEAVIRAALAESHDVQLARQSVEAGIGEYEAAVGRAFPVVVPTAVFEHVEGHVRATEGNLANVGFDTFQPSIALQWVINPGRVYYDIVVARKRLSAVQHLEKDVIQGILHRATTQYYELVLAQSRVAAAHQGMLEAQELLRISRLRLDIGTGVPADELRAQARLAERRQDLVSELQEFYDRSVDLALTLRVHPTVTLVPSLEELSPIRLVSDDLPVDDLLGIAVIFRPDLERVRELVEAAAAERKRSLWDALGPTLTLAYQYGIIKTRANNVIEPTGIPGNLTLNPASPTGAFSSNALANGLIKEGIARGSKGLEGRSDQTTGFHDQQRATAGIGWRLSLASIGDLKVARAVTQQTIIEAERRLDIAQAQVVAAVQASRSQHELIDLASQQVESGNETLRLSEANLRAGTATTLDVLQAQDAAIQGRLRYATAVIRFNQSQVDLLASLGLVTIASLD